MNNEYGVWQDASRREASPPSEGKLGWWIDGAFTIEVEGDLSRYYVRFEPFGYAAIPHKGRIGLPTDLTMVAAQNLKVKLGYDLENEYSILNYAQDELNAFLQLLGGGILVPPHTHVVADITDLEAAVVPYEPTTPANWQEEPLGSAPGDEPNNVGGALDAIAEGIQALQDLKLTIAYSDDPVSDPPTSTNADDAFPGVVYPFMGILDDDGDHDRVFGALFLPDSSWQFWEMFRALAELVFTSPATDDTYTPDTTPTFTWDEV